jgi:arylsulfatase A-like enzyme
MILEKRAVKCSSVLKAVGVVGMTALAGSSVCGQVKSTQKPNILFIFPDQYRRTSMGFWSQPKFRKYLKTTPDPVKTPNIDKLAGEGVVFSRVVSNFPICSPYRAMLMSGMYPENNGIWNNCRKGRKDELRQDAECFTDILNKAGYNTAYFGKCHWHKTEPLFDNKGNFVGKTTAPGGNYVNPYDTYVPPGRSRHSIEYFYQALKDSHFDPRCYSNDPATVAGKKDGQVHLPRKYTPANEAQHVIDYIKNTRGQRDPKKPFVLMWALNPPHSPYDIDNCDLEAYKKYYSPEKVKDFKSLLVRKNVIPEKGSFVRYYFANVTGVDRYIGKVLKALDKAGLKDNTIVVFTADHGEYLGSHGRRGKGGPEIESMAIPFIVRWPGKLKPHVDDMILSVPDVMPTLLGLAGMKNRIPKEVQGTDYAPLFFDPKSTAVKRPGSALFMNGPRRGVYDGQYTLVVVAPGKNRKQQVWLYDNWNDPYQMKKIPISAKPAVAAKMLKKLVYWLKKSNDPWYKNKTLADIIPYGN